MLLFTIIHSVFPNALNHGPIQFRICHFPVAYSQASFAQNGRVSDVKLVSMTVYQVRCYCYCIEASQTVDVFELYELYYTMLR